MFCHRERSCSSTAVRHLFFWLISMLLVQATYEAEACHFDAVTSPWSNCYRLNSSLSCYRTREAACVRSIDNLTAPWYYCTDRGVQRTATVEVCEENCLCQQDCAVSQWSAWSNCDCNQNLYTNRTRVVISPPRNGGLACPALLERKVCLCARNKPFDTQPRRHTWNIDSWGPCRALNTSSQCGVGLRNRAVICVDLEGRTVGVDSCLQEPAYSSLVPPSSQTHCELPCPCVLGEWGAFSCIAQCEQRTSTGLQTRFRPVIQYPTIGLSCDNTTEETLPCTLTENSCPIFIWSSSSWSECNFQTGATCGYGHTTRFVYCLEVWNGTMRDVGHSRCEKLANTSRPAEIMACSVTCPQACLVGEWSEWSQCPRACQSTYRNRTKTIIVPPLLNELCSPLLELVQCPILPCARWLPGEYTTCTPFSATCGKGFQSRNINCVEPNNDIISDRACDHLLRPHSSITCHKPCPNDCVVSDWSQWSSCSVTCGGHVGNQTRTRHFVAGGLSCPYNDTDLLETRNCSSYEECVPAIFFIKQLPWGVCVPVKVALNSSSSPTTDIQFDEFGNWISCSVMGTHNHTSVCMRGDQVVSASECPIEFQLEIEPCDLACSRECVYSEWSPFSECLCNMGMGRRNRSRHLIQFSSFGSTLCIADENGIQLEIEICNSMCDDVAGVGWVTSEWSQCHFYRGISPQGECGIGYRNRTVNCIEYSTELIVSELLCLLSRPAAVSSCYVECTQKCLVTEWSQFSGCTYSGNRTRQRRIVPYSGCNNWELCCPHLATISLHESVPCPSSVSQLNMYEYIASSYSSCILHSSQATCGNGRMFLKNLCVFISLPLFVPADDSFCKLAGSSPSTESQACNIKCELDCVQTDWGPWSLCSVSCGSGYRTRTRTIHTPPETGGRPCGLSLETDVCFRSPCLRVEILPGPFGRCVSSNMSSLCGVGVRVRDPVCLLDGVTHDLDECGNAGVTSSFPISEACMAPCSGECVVGEWGQWSPCSTNCPIGSCRRTRTRVILRETESCSESVQEIQTCYAPVLPYVWYVGPWKDCILDSLETSTATASVLRGHYCGVGLHRRFVSCLNGTESVHKSFCMAAGLRRPEAVENCSLPCPRDCKVGAFSDWTECVVCELSSFQQRERHVMVLPQSGGRDCLDLVQKKYCIPTGCVLNTLINHTSLESVDYTSDGQCGKALKLEPRSCLRNTEFVSTSECLDDATTMTEKYIPLPCPSEPNCTYNEWSDWSDCVSLCTCLGHPFRHRYRHLVSSYSRLTDACRASQNQIDECLVRPTVVPENENRTEMWNGTEMVSTTSKPATDVCIDFIWHTSQWNGDGRDVYCQSNTGIRLDDMGCLPFTMPRSQNETCVNVTCSDYATCSDNEGVCLQTCQKNFEAVGKLCLPRSGCADHTHCLAPNMECNHISGSCGCRESYQQTEIGDLCMLTATAATSVVYSYSTTITAGSPGLQLGVLYISLICALPLLIVIALIIALIIVMYSCVKNLEQKEHLNSRRLKASISSPHQVKLHCGEEDSNWGIPSDSNGFVDGMNSIQLHTYRPTPLGSSSYSGSNMMAPPPLGEYKEGGSREPDVPRYMHHPLSCSVHPIPITGPVSPGCSHHRSTPNSPVTQQRVALSHRGLSLPYLSNLPDISIMTEDTMIATSSSVGSLNFNQSHCNYDSEDVFNISENENENSYMDMQCASPIYARVRRSWEPATSDPSYNEPLERKSPSRYSRRDVSHHGERDSRIAVGLDSSMLHAINQLGAGVESQPPSSIDSTHTYSSDMISKRCYHGSHDQHSCWYGDGCSGINHSIAHLPSNRNHTPTRDSSGYRSKSMPRPQVHFSEKQLHNPHQGYMTRHRDYYRGDGEHPHQGQRALHGEERHTHQQQLLSPSNSPPPPPRNLNSSRRHSTPANNRNLIDHHHDSSGHYHGSRSPPQQYHSLHSCKISNQNCHHDNKVPHRYFSRRQSSPAANYYRSQPSTNSIPPILLSGCHPKSTGRNKEFNTYAYPTHCQPLNIQKVKMNDERERNPTYARPRPFHLRVSAPSSASRQEMVTSIYDYPRLHKYSSTSTPRLPIMLQHRLVETCQSTGSSPNVVALPNLEQPSEELTSQSEQEPIGSTALGQYPSKIPSPQRSPMVSCKCNPPSPLLTHSKLEDTS